MLIESGVSLARFTTYRIGGKAKWFFVPKNIQELKEILSFAKRKKLPWFILGNGSNILISDEGYPGLVLKLAGEFKQAIFDEKNHLITIGAAVSLPRFALECARLRIDGFECLGDIPGTVGAAVRINAGIKGGEIKDHFVSADLLDDQGGIQTLNAEEMAFGYRTSVLIQNNWIVLRARFEYGAEKDTNEILATIERLRSARRAKRPANSKNCGSVFKAVGGKAAGWYIEQCGLKGKRIGGAMISHEHANWIVNIGSAKSADVKALIELVRRSVGEQFGVNLEREVEFVPEDLSVRYVDE